MVPEVYSLAMTSGVKNTAKAMTLIRLVKLGSVFEVNKDYIGDSFVR